MTIAMSDEQIARLKAALGESADIVSLLTEYHAILADTGHVIIQQSPDQALLVSMSVRYDHAFGLLSADGQRSTMVTMSQLHEEVSGLGFYKPERRAQYLAMIKPAGAPAADGFGLPFAFRS